MIKVVLIDDEKNASEMLEWQLQAYCPQVETSETTQLVLNIICKGTQKDFKTYCRQSNV